MSYETIEFSLDDGLATVTLNRPDKLNALVPEMLKELLDVCQRIEDPATGARCLLITGAGRAFSSGADLSSGSAGGAGDDRGAAVGETLRNNYHPTMKKLAALPVPTISAVNGVAAGAGMSLAIIPDFVLAARSAYFLQAFVNIGLIPDAGSTYMLPRLIGKARATEMMMLGERVPADKAAEWGLIYKVVDDDKLMEEATALGQRLAKGPTTALASIHEALACSPDNDFAAQLEVEAGLQHRAANTDDSVEGVMAFLQKRPAEFKGK